jgi:hypothetical protein
LNKEGVIILNTRQNSTSRKNLYLGLILFAGIVVLLYINIKLVHYYKSGPFSRALHEWAGYSNLLTTGSLLFMFLMFISHLKFARLLFALIGSCIGAIIAISLPCLYVWSTIILLGYRHLEIWGFAFFIMTQPFFLIIFLLTGWYVFGYWDRIRKKLLEKPHFHGGRIS